MHVPFARLPEELGGLRSRPVDVVLDMVPYVDKGGHGVLRFTGAAARAVVISVEARDATHTVRQLGMDDNGRTIEEREHV